MFSLENPRDREAWWAAVYGVAQSRTRLKRLSSSNAGDLGLTPGSGRCPGKGNGNPLQYPCLENSMDSGAWQAMVHGVTELDMTERLYFPWRMTKAHRPS